MGKPIRFKEATIQITVSSVRLGGSLNKVTDFSAKPDAEIMKTRYAGEKRDSPDLDVKGWDLSFSHHKQDRIWFDLWRTIEGAEENGDDFPEISIAVTDSYRGTTSPLTVVFHGELMLKMDEDGRPNGDYQSVSWSGFCKYCD